MTADQGQAGRIVFLNGTSSSGKSSLAAALLRRLEPLHFHLAVDAFNAMSASRDLSPEELDLALRRMRSGFHRAIAGMAAAGNHVVVDHVLSEPWRLRDCLEVLAPYEVLLVGVRCALPELERRERARGDRPAGLAALQYERVHAHGVYDLEVDTGRYSSEECAAQIAAHLEGGAKPTAFDELRFELS
ncbi:AAA family ATPase [Kitasatospora sp. NPDC002040]|uniref:chloramphenicol phosphotransferase CPT family protein n=1 Tax=Kitasatospora sp. NPDC002040 TaxID=3154661 RepID=UPI003330A439